jgi:hypothetical protein
LRSQLAQSVRERFESCLSNRLPSFCRIPAPTKGDRLYQWEVGPTYWIYVLLHPHHLGDVFVVEVAWTRGLPFPGGYSKSSKSGRHGFERFRLHELWNERAPLDLWWIGGRPRLDLTEGGLPQLRPEAELIDEAGAFAEDAVGRLVAFGLPYLSKIGKALGYNMVT